MNMKTETLRSLGITDQTVIDAIMAENGKDINAAKGNKEQLESQITALQEQLNDRDTQLKELKKSVKDNETLTAKITELETANETAKTDYQNKITEIQKTHAIENGVRDAKAKNVKAVIAQLDMSKITFADGKVTGLAEQLEALHKSEDTSFLFASDQPTVPSGTKINNPPTGGTGSNPPTSGTWQEAVAKALGGNK
jgi:septal ring factor EnvC (AmiA/AmiB activator)